MPGAHSVVSAEGGVGDQTSGWDGKQYVVRIKPQNGPAVTDSYSAVGRWQAPGGEPAVAQYELPAVTINRIYDPTS